MLSEEELIEDEENNASCFENSENDLQITKDETTQSTSIDVEELQTRNQRKELHCHECGRKFRTQHRFEGHMRVHQGLKPALCNICGKQFMQWYNLKLHLKYKHSNRNLAKIACDFKGCNASFATKQGLTVHQRRHDPKYVKPASNKYVCESCGKTFLENNGLKKHLYTHTGDMPFQCEICDKKLPTAYKLKIHKLRHQGIKNFECPHCGIKKITSDELKAHMNCHTKEKRFTCDQCEQVFSNSGNLTRHVRLVHHRVKAFKCSYCHRSFGKAETLKHHVMTHTGEKPHECAICFKRFIQLVALQTHTKVHAECTNGLPAGK
ncbi:zinc finger protein 501-like [Anopheles nili]|uniref:zinc finger protein 501-like n=1 Tax=Anopheles nili TaxID=185578 RepID=UPI00237B9983|nr:zinc finger protein 501-like [Anopheles nili]